MKIIKEYASIDEYTILREANGRPVLALRRAFQALEQNNITRQVKRAIAFAVENPSTSYAQSLAEHPKCPPEVIAAVDSWNERCLDSWDPSDPMGCLSGNF